MASGVDGTPQPPLLPQHRITTPKPAFTTTSSNSSSSTSPPRQQIGNSGGGVTRSGFRADPAPSDRLPSSSTPSATTPRSAQLPVGCPRVPTPDILATTPAPPPFPPAAGHPNPEHGHGGGPPPQVPGPHPHHHHYQPGAAAPPYSRRAVPVGVGDQMLVASMLPAMYPALPGSHLPPSSSQQLHPGGIPPHLAAGRNPLATTDLGYHHIPHHHPSNADPNLNRLDALPDILHSHNVGHAPQPRPNQHRSGSSAAAAANRHQRQRQQQNTRHGRSRGTTTNTGREGGGGGRSRRRSRTHSGAASTTTDSGRCKEPCVKCMVTVTSLRWVLLVLSMLGVMFVVAGIVMAALHAAGNDFLIYALVFIGLGVVLVAVVVVAWKCSPPGSEPIHALFNIGDTRSGRRERRPRRTHRLRDGQWHGGMMYPEFQYRRPPPSYAASMQAYQVQMADAAQSNNNTATLVNNNNSDDYSLPGSPPPSYRSRASTIHSGMHITFPPGHDSAPNSRPPTYRSRADSHQRPRLPIEDFEAMSPSTAPGDVSFTGPSMTMDTVQQIIGTARSHHRRQQSAGATVWHTRSSSLDMAQGTDGIYHRRGASLDHSTVNVTLGLNSQENQTPRPQQLEGAIMVQSSEPAADSGAGNASSSLQPVAGSSQPTASREKEQTVDRESAQIVRRENKQTANNQTASSDSRQRVETDAPTRERGAGSGGDGVTSVAYGNSQAGTSEPEQYNTAL